jgi:hypothetical protein
MTDAAKQLWTPADLAARWQCSVGSVMRLVREKGVPFKWFSRGAPRLNRRGTRMIRFDPREIEAWEAEQGVRWEPEQDRPAVVSVRVQGLMGGGKARVRD